MSVIVLQFAERGEIPNRNTYYLELGQIVAFVAATDSSTPVRAEIPFGTDPRKMRKHQRFLRRIDGENWQLESCELPGLPRLTLCLKGFPDAFA